jgi:hypothetical protein
MYLKLGDRARVGTRRESDHGISGNDPASAVQYAIVSATWSFIPSCKRNACATSHNVWLGGDASLLHKYIAPESAGGVFALREGGLVVEQNARASTGQRVRPQCQQCVEPMRPLVPYGKRIRCAAADGSTPTYGNVDTLDKECEQKGMVNKVQETTSLKVTVTMTVIKWEKKFQKYGL